MCPPHRIQTLPVPFVYPQLLAVLQFLETRELAAWHLRCNHIFNFHRKRPPYCRNHDQPVSSVAILQLKLPLHPSLHGLPEDPHQLLPHLRSLSSSTHGVLRETSSVPPPPFPRDSQTALETQVVLRVPFTLQTSLFMSLDILLIRFPKLLLNMHPSNRVYVPRLLKCSLSAACQSCRGRNSAQFDGSKRVRWLPLMVPPYGLTHVLRTDPRH